MTQTRRADILLVERGLFESRARAQAAIAAGLVVADGVTVVKPSQSIAIGAEIAAEPAWRHVSRGGLKLEAALDAFGIDPAGAIAADIGSSTGGFTQVLLERGAARVYAVDSGRGQLHDSLLGDPRIVLLEETDARRLDQSLIPQPLTLIVADVSFISLTLALPAVLGLAAPGARLAVLVKPQFEVGRARVGKGGIVRDEAAREEACGRIAEWIAAKGWRIDGRVASPITGGDGNREYLLGATRMSGSAA